MLNFEEVSIRYEFVHPITNERESYYFDLTFDECLESVVEYVNKYYGINLDGTNTDVYNFLEDMDCFFSLTRESRFEDYCKEKFEELAFEKWKEEYDYLHADEEDF